MRRLSARKVETAKPGVYLDGQGLRLVVGETGSRKWVFRFMRRGVPKRWGWAARTFRWRLPETGRPRRAGCWPGGKTRLTGRAWPNGAAYIRAGG